MPVDTLRATAYGEIARAQMAAGDPIGARDTAQRATAVIAAAETEDDQVFGVPTAAIAQMRAGDLDGAESTIASVSNNQNRVLAYSVYAVALQDAGHSVQARKAASHALETAIGIEGDFIVFAAWSMAVTGDASGAQRIAEGLNRRDNRGGLRALIAEAQLEAGDIAGALATADSIGENIEGSNNEAWVFSRFVRGVAVDPIAVFDDLLLESRTPLKAIVMTRIAMAQARAGDSSNARQSFLASVGFAEMANSLASRVLSIGTIALYRAQSGDISGAIESLDYAGRLADQSAGDDDLKESRIYLQIVRNAIDGRTMISELMQQRAGIDRWGESLVISAIVHNKLGSPGQAGAYLAAAAEHLSGDDRLSVLAAAYASLAERHMSRRDRAGARAAARQSLAIADRIAEATEDKVIGLFFAAVALARSGDIALALETAARIQKRSGQ